MKLAEQGVPLKIWLPDLEALRPARKNPCKFRLPISRTKGIMALIGSKMPLVHGVAGALHHGASYVEPLAL